MKRSGNFSTNFSSIEIQLKAMFEEVGGDNALELLDEVSELHPSEQKTALALFTRVVKKFAGGELRFPTEGDLALKRFEEDLYNDLIKEFEKTPKADNRLLRLVADIEAATPADEPIDFVQARRARAGTKHND